MVFIDRTDAGRRLGEALRHLRESAPVVLGLTRGGVPVAAEVARALEAPLDVIVVRKLGVPFQPELGMGAVGEDGVRVVNDEVVRDAGIKDDELALVESRERAEVERRAQRYRAGGARLDLAGRTAVVVDDGIATGSTAKAACKAARARGAARVVLAVPVAPPGWERRIGDDADEFVCLETPEWLFAVGQFYADFPQTSDEEVLDCLEQARRRVPCTAAAGRGVGDPPVSERELDVPAGPNLLRGSLRRPEQARGLVVFAHGSGSSRHSPRNRFVAGVLNDAGFATLLFDLLTEDEEADRANVFDIALLAQRLGAVTDWLRALPEVAGLPVGYFGASTGAAAALWAAAEAGRDVAAVVSRGGRPDLAGERLGDVRAPTLLIVGGHDDLVLELNREARRHLHCESRLVVIPGATHLFEEPGTLRAAAEAARDWFADHLQRLGAPTH